VTTVRNEDVTRQQRPAVVGTIRPDAVKMRDGDSRNGAARPVPVAAAGRVCVNVVAVEARSTVGHRVQPRGSADLLRAHAQTRDRLVGVGLVRGRLRG
jgi:hypothetical protein